MNVAVDVWLGLSNETRVRGYRAALNACSLSWKCRRNDLGIALVNFCPSPSPSACKVAFKIL